MGFPLVRPRRLRRTPALRTLVRETSLEPKHLVLPLFFHATHTEPVAISTLPGVFQLPISHAARTAKELILALQLTSLSGLAYAAILGAALAF